MYSTETRIVSREQKDKDLERGNVFVGSTRAEKKPIAIDPTDYDENDVKARAERAIEEYDLKPLTRKERANNVIKRDFLSRYGDQAREVLEALLDQYMNVGIYELESMDVLKLDPLKKFGAPAKIVKLFGGKDGYLKAVRKLEELIYIDEAI